MTVAMSRREDRRVNVLSHLAIACPDLLFTKGVEDDDLAVRCSTSNVYVVMNASDMWVCLGNIEVHCKTYTDVTDGFRNLLGFERALELECGATTGDAVAVTFAKYAAQIKAVPGFANVEVETADDDYQRHFVLEVFARGVDTPFVRIELEFCNPNPQRSCGPGKEYAAYFRLQEVQHKMVSFAQVITALKSGDPYSPESDPSKGRMQSVAPSTLYSVCGNECAVRARDVLYCLPELLRLGYTDFALQKVETRLAAVLPKLRMLSPISSLINDPGTIDVYVGRIPKVT